jgi:hypothetical protein
MSVPARKLLRRSAPMMKTRLREIACSPGMKSWADSCPETAFAGVCRMETQHATYLFRNGSCFAVSGRGLRAGTTSSDLVGMRIVGWLLHEDEVTAQAAFPREVDAAPVGKVRVSRNWRAGSRAVLVAKGSFLRGTRTAVTSRSTAFSKFGSGMPSPKAPAFDGHSLTRLHAAAPAV